MIERPSARLILLDPQDRLFLFNVHDPQVFDPANPFFDPFWVMIGGMVDPGEDYAQAAVREDKIDRIKAMICFIEEQTGEAEYSEILVRRMVEKVTIHDDRITVEFKSGLAIDVDM